MLKKIIILFILGVFSINFSMANNKSYSEILSPYFKKAEGLSISSLNNILLKIDDKIEDIDKKITESYDVSKVEKERLILLKNEIKKIINKKIGLTEQQRKKIEDKIANMSIEQQEKFSQNYITLRNKYGKYAEVIDYIQIKIVISIKNKEENKLNCLYKGKYFKRGKYIKDTIKFYDDGKKWLECSIEGKILYKFVVNKNYNNINTYRGDDAVSVYNNAPSRKYVLENYEVFNTRNPYIDYEKNKDI